MKHSAIKHLILSSLFLCSLSGFAFEYEELPQEVQEELSRATRSVTNSALTTQYDYSAMLYPTIVSATGAHLNVPEKKYSLYKNIAFSATGRPQYASTTEQKCMIKISANDVTLDLQGFTLSTDQDDITAIIIEPNVTHVTIKNGTIGISASSTETTNFLNGILCRSGCTDITLENIIVEKIVDGYPINFAGESGHRIETVTLKNVTSNKHSGEVEYAINFDQVDKINIENISSNFLNSTSALKLCKIDSCNDISIERLESSFNQTSSTSGIKAIDINSCNNISIKNVSIHDNTYIFNTGIYISNVKKALCSNIAVNNNSSVDSNDVKGFFIAGNNSAISIDNYTFTNNTATEALFGLSCSSTPNLSISTAIISSNISTQNSFTGLLITNAPKANLSNIDISNNVSSEFVATNFTKGIELTSSSNSSLNNINVSENLGGYQAQGIYVDSSRNCIIQNSIVNHNSAGTSMGVVGQSGGIFLVDSSYNLVKNCEASYNLGGDYDGSSAVATSTTDADTTTSAAFELRLFCAGFIDYAKDSAIQNKNNIFDNCVARGNQTQWNNTVLPGNQTSSGRFATQAALEAGFYLQSTLGATIKNSTAEQNGSFYGSTGNAYIAGHGIHLEGTTALTKILNSEVSKNTWHGIYGFMNTLTVLASQNIAYSNSTSTLAQDTATGFGLSILEQNFHFPNLSENIPYNMTATLDFSSITIEKRGENIIYHVIPDDAITY